MFKKFLLLGVGLLLFAITATAQQLVTGKVTDAYGEPVMGATVRVPGTKIHATTDVEGKFKLSNVPATAKKLQVSYIGKQTETVKVAPTVSIVLQDNELGEAVVVGYGSAQKVGTVVGSVKKVGGETVADKPAINIADALQGQVSGLQIYSNSGDPGDYGDMSLRLRGVGSLGASNTPLIVIDGSPASTAMFAMLNDNDIESITTLKDASATSIYGSRAANGVIYITTKKGRLNEKAVIKVSQSIGWSQLANGIGNPMNTEELLEFQLENNIIQSDKYQEYKLNGANTNWQRYLFDNAAPMYNTDFSIQGGSGSTTYYVSGSYMKENSLTKVSHFKRYTMRTNLDTKPKEWLTFGVKQTIAYTDRRSDQWTNQSYGQYLNNSATASYMFPSYWDPYDEEYAAKHMIKYAETYDYQWVQTKLPTVSNDIVYNGVAYALIQPIKGLTIKSQLGLYATDTRYNRDLLSSYPETDTGWSYESHNRTSLWTITNTAEYKFDVKRDHHFTLLAGQEGIKYSSKSFGVQGTGTTDDRLPTLASATAAEVPDYSSSKYEYLSFFGRVDYNWKEKYYANFTVRNDQSSRFGADNRAANFFSGGLMWHIAAEDFMLPTRGWLSDLQIKASIGSTGNSEIGNYESLGLITTTQYNGESGWVLAQASNEELGWEKQVQFNFGFYTRLFDCVSLDLNIYKKKTLDMLMDVPLAYTTGFSEQTVNVGEMSNRGVEIDINWDIIRTRDLYVGLYANYSYAKNRIDELFYDLDEWPMPDYLISYIKGESLNYYMPIYAGVDKEDGAPMWYKKGYTGGVGYTYNEETMTKTFSDDLYQDTGKSRFAPHSGGFGFSLAWKGITFNADFSYVLGKWMANNEYFFATSSQNALNGYNQSKDMLSMWKNPGDEAFLPGMEYDSQFDTHILQNASFMRLKNLSVSYDLPKAWMRATRVIENVRFSFAGRNIFTVTKYKGADPELDSNLSLGNFPATRQFTLGVEVTF